MIWLLISLGISYAIVQPYSFGGFIGTILLSFIIDLIAIVVSGIGRR
ncbi:hypothetical protein MUU45_000329 [Rodentibacter pneumotropicus]|uniref:Uncharacterized protein n=1 Tax=Rodentibacter pneumotropicus TaxID=758 RepID=A0AAW5L8B1_9PAST|nr:hypothetical protein [Rodentibacter pneumotropicus]MCQ9120523.1 hypothetical protein [Rodentibacter pneumotropicus]